MFVALYASCSAHVYTVTVGDDMAVREVGVAPESLDKRCSDDHLRSVSLFLDWQTVAPHLGLSETDQEEIESDGKKNPAKRLKTLVKWKGKFAFKATYKSLIEVLLTTGKANHEEEVCKLLKGITVHTEAATAILV